MSPEVASSSSSREAALEMMLVCVSITPCAQGSGRSGARRKKRMI